MGDENEVGVLDSVNLNSLEANEELPILSGERKESLLAEELSDPLMVDETWSDFVLKQFGEDELMDGNPTVDGLRRVARKLLGDIFLSECNVIQAPTTQNGFCATVEHKVGIKWYRELDEYSKEDRYFKEVADVNEQNCEAEYRRFASSTASTRAEARALRKALMLKRVIAAEEVTTVAPIADNPTEQGKITLAQINFLVNIAKRNDIHLMKYINMGRNKYRTINEVPYATAIKMSGALSSFQQKPESKPEKIKGWSDSWATYWDTSWDVKNEIPGETK